MDENKKPDQNVKTPIPSLINNSVETSKEGVRPYLEDAADRLSKPDDKVNWNSGMAMKAAVFSYIADIAKLNGEARKQAAQHWAKSPIWFGSNASAGRQAYEAKQAKVEGMKDYSDW